MAPGWCMWASGAWDLGGQHRAYEKNTSFTSERLLALVEEFQACGVKGVEITGGGEPTIHHAFPAFVHALVDAGIKVGVISNGQGWKPDTIAALARCTFLRVSMSSLNEDVHRKIRNPKAKGWKGSAARVLVNVARVAALPGPADRRIGIGVTIEAANWEELPEFPFAVREAGADNLRLTYVWVDNDAEVYGPIEAGIQEAVVRTRAEAARHGIEVFGPNEWREYQIAGNASFDKCSYGLFVCNITADGRLWPCCIQRWVDGWSYGNVMEQRFDEIMLSRERNDFVRSIDVKKCMPCIFFDKNRDLQPYAYEGKTPSLDLGPSPPHAEFV